MEESLAALRSVGVDARAWLATGRRVSESPMAARIRARGVPVHERTADTLFAPASVLDLGRTLRGMGRGSILHTHGERALLWGRVAARLAGVKHVHTNHGFIENDGSDRRRVSAARRLLRGVDAVIAVHPSAAVELPGAVLVPNCLDSERFVSSAPERNAARSRLALVANDRCYLFLGRLSHEKGADLLGLVQKELQERSAAAVLCVAGSGPLAFGVDAMADVRLLGSRDDSAALLRAADVVLMPSRREGLPMVGLEAAAVGTPVVGFAVGGLADSGLAIPVPPEDVTALVETALRVVRTPQLRARVSQRARDVLASDGDPLRHATQLSDLYRAL